MTGDIIKTGYTKSRKESWTALPPVPFLMLLGEYFLSNLNAFCIQKTNFDEGKSSFWIRSIRVAHGSRPPAVAFPNYLCTLILAFQIPCSD